MGCVHSRFGREVQGSKARIRSGYAKFLVESEEESVMLAEVAMTLGFPSQPCFKAAVVVEKGKMHIDESPTESCLKSLHYTLNLERH